MIGEGLQLITDELNAYIGRKDPNYRDKTIAFVSDLLNQEGKTVFEKLGDDGDQDYLLLTLINIEEETVGKSQVPYIQNPDQSVAVANPELKINLYVLVSTFSEMDKAERYRNCLNMISHVIRFFQFKSVFNHQNSPSLHQDIEKLLVEMVSPTFEQQNHMWGTLGAKYMSSVLYKVRMLTFRETDEAATGPVIQEIHKDEHDSRVN